MTCEEIIHKGYFDCRGRLVKLNYKGCLIYGCITNVKLNYIVVKSNISLGCNGCNRCEDKEIMLAKEEDIEINFISRKDMVSIYSQKLGRNIPDISELSYDELYNLEEKLSFMYKMSMGYKGYRLRVEVATDDTGINNSLRREYIMYLDEVAELTKREFMNIKGIGKESVKVMEQVLGEYSLSFRDA